MPRLHLIHLAQIQVVSTCIADKIVVTATCIHLYPQVEHCIELVSIYIYPSTCIRLRVDGYLYPATCISCKRGFTSTVLVGHREEPVKNSAAKSPKVLSEIFEVVI